MVRVTMAPATLVPRGRRHCQRGCHETSEPQRPDGILPAGNQADRGGNSPKAMSSLADHDQSVSQSRNQGYQGGLFPCRPFCVCSLNCDSSRYGPSALPSREGTHLVATSWMKKRYSLSCVFVWGTIGEQLLPNKVISPRIRAVFPRAHETLEGPCDRGSHSAWNREHWRWR
jgi:hypothetical protein